MTTLHNEIMNIQCAPPDDANMNKRLSFKEGHKQARHAAAELALTSDARIEALEQDNASLREQNSMVDAKCAELEAALHRIGDMAHDASTGPAVPDTLWDIRCEAYELLKD